LNQRFQFLQELALQDVPSVKRISRKSTKNEWRGLPFVAETNATSKESEPGVLRSGEVPINLEERPRWCSHEELSIGKMEEEEQVWVQVEFTKSLNGGSLRINLFVM
jgi:hypothetical protein